jgi:uncharacterized membrane protein
LDSARVKEHGGGRLCVIAALMLAFLTHCAYQRPDDSETTPRWEALRPAVRAEARQGRVDFARHVKPILQAKCVMCHSGRQPEGGFRMEKREFAFSEGAGGRRIVAGDALRSPLIRNIDEAHAGMKIMPPVGSRVTDAEKDILRRWIDQGAVWPAGRQGRLSTEWDGSRN